MLMFLWRCHILTRNWPKRMLNGRCIVRYVTIWHRGCVYGMVYNGSACTFPHCSIATFYIVPNNDCPAPRRQPTLFGQASLEFEEGGSGGASFYLGLADMLTQRPPFRFGSRVFSDWSAICPFVWHPPSVENKNKMLQDLLKSYLQLLVFAACWEHLPNKGNMANIRGANLPNHHKQSNCQTAQLRLQTALRQDLFTFPCSRPPHPKFATSHLATASEVLWPHQAVGQTTDRRF